ncbi:peptidase [Lysobacteraceae bacterium NML03-0222]|nr:peptidase [Xanthomonadaceae bacterium NML03-0222]
MAWVHTWLGLVLGFVLMVCFFFGTLSVFDREIDRWAVPATRFAAQPMPDFHTRLWPAWQTLLPKEADYQAEAPRLHDPAKGALPPRNTLQADQFWAYTTHRDPVVQIGARFVLPTARDDVDDYLYASAQIDPRSGKLLPDGAFNIGSDWFYPMHYHLNWAWLNLGYWLVGLAGMVMLLALISGVILHRKLFRELFTFRPDKQRLRSLLDLHNLSGVVALPFHLFFAFTGVLIFAAWLYLPVGHSLLQPLHDRHAVHEASASGLPHQRSGKAQTHIAPVTAMVQQAKQRWAERGMPGEVGLLELHHVGDADAYISIHRAGSDRVALVGQALHFKASSGALLHEAPPQNPVAAVHEYLSGLHLQHFRHWLLRWLYLLGGLLGCICIATGFLFFVEKRKQQHARQGRQGSRVVDALAITAITGMVLAALAILVANRLLPESFTALGWQSSDWQKAAFWGVWLAAGLHAWLRSAPLAQGRPNPAWREQCLLVAVLALLAVALNWLSTGDHLLKTLITERYWPVAGVDMALLLSALTALWTARRLGERTRRAEGE